jgi:hypothetical protein
MYRGLGLPQISSAPGTESDGLTTTGRHQVGLITPEGDNRKVPDPLSPLVSRLVFILHIVSDIKMDPESVAVFMCFCVLGIHLLVVLFQTSYVHCFNLI